ncbi:bifunctional endo-1,4-beta-xylanase XylA-like [Thalictrum thalictroides]|uniref:Bifunctional endo-1,4-beta-xylanase XylA-like n=1 Tax=Thalictrum thalictroides TaxID=46969 RepID=A0A7J6WT46_THATH|nr:bifunctional endo-1,4-beta-xylanase XylA-like [Thalictrum thalictroides]
MGDWRRNRSDSYNNYNQNYQSVPKSSARSQYRKPPALDSWQTDRHSWQPALPSWQPPIPSWEKSFVINVGKIPWKRFMYCQKGLDLYPDVYQWDDSAGADAFHNAKSRYWAEINGRPFDNSLPDPDMHIDQIDWNAEIDPELYKDLENAFVTPVEEVKDIEAGFVANSLYCSDQPIVPSGWGDEDDNSQANNKNASNNDNPWVSQSGWDDVPWGLRSLLKPVITFGCGDGEDDSIKAANNTVCNPSLQDGDKKTSIDNNPWEKNSGGWEGIPWGSSSQLNNTTNELGNLNCSRNNNNSWEGISGGWEGVPSSQENWNYSKKTSNNNNPWEGSAGGWEGVPWGPSSQVNNTTNEVENLNYSGNGGSWKGGNDNWRKRESEGQRMSRYKTTRYHGEDHQRNQGWKNNRGRRRVSFAHEHSPLEPLAPRQWNPIDTCGPTTTHHRPGNPENSWGWDKQVSNHIN